MTDEASLFDQAADALSRALSATGVAEQSVLLEKALHLNRLALAAEQAKLSTQDDRPVSPEMDERPAKQAPDATDSE